MSAFLRAQMFPRKYLSFSTGKEDAQMSGHLWQIFRCDQVISKSSFWFSGHMHLKDTRDSYFFQGGNTFIVSLEYLHDIVSACVFLTQNQK